MKAADTKSTTTAAPKSNTPFFEKGQGSFFAPAADHASDTNQTFFSAAPAIQKAPATAPATTPNTTSAPAATTAPAATATAPAAITAPTPTAARAPIAELAPEIKDLKQEAKVDAAKIKDILRDNRWLTEGDQRPIMAIVWKYGIKPPLLNSRLTPFDYLMVALQSQTFTIGTVTTQWTNVFDQLMHRMSDDNIALFKSWMHIFGKFFNNEKANEEVKFEIKKEHLVQGLEMVGDVTAATAELAAAGLTGGASELAILAKWLIDTLPELYSSAKTIIGVVDTIRNLKKDDLKKLFSAGGMGNVLVKSLFGELQGLPVPGGEEEKEEKDTTADRGAKGFMKMLGSIKRVITSLVSAYRKLAGFVNSTLGTLDLTRKDWFESFSMAYAGVMNTVEAAMDPGGAIDKATGALKDMTSNFFESVKGKLGEVVGSIKDRLTIITEPARLLKTMADKAVEWVLNFIITHPPSRLFKLLGKLITSLSGKSIVELLREKVSFADDIIKKIADSEPVQKLVSPLKGPVTGITTIVDSIAGKAGDFIGNMETRVLAFMSNGGTFLKEMTGAKQNPAKTANTNENEKTAEGDTLGNIKTGIHSRLMTIGGRLLLEKGKQLGKAAVEKGKTAALDWWNRKVKFKSIDEQNHTLYFSGQGKNTQLIVATTPMPVTKVLSQIANLPAIKNKATPEHAAHKQANQLVADADALIKKLQTRETGGYTAADTDKLNSVLEALSDQMQLLLPLIAVTPGTNAASTPTVRLNDMISYESWRYIITKMEHKKLSQQSNDTPIVLTCRRVAPPKYNYTLDLPLDTFTKAMRSGSARIVTDNITKRDEYLGTLSKGPRKRIENEVTKRMTAMWKYKPATDEFKNRPPAEGWYPVSQADLGHIIDAVTWWNSNGRFFGPQSPEAKTFMEDAANYEWEEKGQNRSRGAALGQEYLPPVYK
jgi:hypothetical protein